MPFKLLPLLQSRVSVLIISHMYEITCPYATFNELIELDTLLSRYEMADAHHFILNARQLGILKRFLEAERILALASRKPLLLLVSNTEFWIMLGELMASMQRPTRLINLSFYGQA